MVPVIDICGMPIQLDKVKEFSLIRRECIFFPTYQETVEQTNSVFAKWGAKNKKKFQFIKMVPYGVLLTGKEIPSGKSHEIKYFGEEATKTILDRVLHTVAKPAGNLVNTAVDAINVDTSGNREFRVLTQGRRVINVKLRDISAKVRFLSGKVSDVYLNDSIYTFLGEPIAPSILPIVALVVVIDKETHVFFGESFDIDDPETTYNMLCDAYNQFRLSAEERDKSHAGLLKLSIQLPKMDKPTINIPSPFTSGSNRCWTQLPKYLLLRR